MTLDIDHAKCDPALHDFDAPGSNEQARVGMQMTCNDDGQPLFYCETSGWYHHIGADAVPCFMVKDDGYDVKTPHAADAARAMLIATWARSWKSDACLHSCITAGCGNCGALATALKAASMPLPVSPDTEPDRFTEEEAAIFRKGQCCWVTEYGTGHGIVHCRDESKRGADFGHCWWHDIQRWAAGHGH